MDVRIFQDAVCDIFYVPVDITKKSSKLDCLLLFLIFGQIDVHCFVFIIG